MAPPGRSRLPVAALTTSTSQEASVPNSAVVVPLRPYTQAGGEAAVGGGRVGAEEEQVAGAVDVGDGDGDRRAEHQRRGDLLRPLVDGAGGEDVAGAEPLEDGLEVQLPPEVVDRRVPDVGAESSPAMSGDDGAEQAAGLGVGLVPPDLHEVPVAPHHRRPQPVGVLVELLEGRALGAEVA